MLVEIALGKVKAVQGRIVEITDDSACGLCPQAVVAVLENLLGPRLRRRIRCQRQLGRRVVGTDRE